MYLQSLPPVSPEHISPAPPGVHFSNQQLRSPSYVLQAKNKEYFINILIFPAPPGVHSSNQQLRIPSFVFQAKNREI